MGALRGPRPSRTATAISAATTASNGWTTAGDTASRPEAESPDQRRGKRRAYVREYLRWLRPHRFAVATVFVLALVTAGLQMIEPLFIRFIIDRVLLNTALDTASRLAHLHRAGLVYLAVIFASSLFGVLKDYRQRLLNVRVMLAVQSLFHWLLHCRRPRLWDMEDLAASVAADSATSTRRRVMQMAIVSRRACRLSGRCP
jgi:ATP-binding cassette subfamily B protein/subfamily B ATP-binding cassette protein MsbA